MRHLVSFPGAHPKASGPACVGKSVFSFWTEDAEEAAAVMVRAHVLTMYI